MARHDTQYLKRAIRATAREAVWSTVLRHEQGDRRNILLFATRRGGSTFAMELIGANRGIRPLNQPLETQSRNLTFAQALEIPRFRQGQITSLDEHDAARLGDLVERIFAGDVVINAPTKFWRPDVDLTSDRLVLKLTDCKPVIGWFDDTFDADIVYLTRHPIPQSLSCIRNHWTLTVDAHLADPAFVEANLDDRGLAAAHDTMRSGSPLLQFCLNWALENIAPLRLLPERPDWVHVRYEQTVADPHSVFEMLADRLELVDVDRMNDVLSRPSQSSRRSTESTRQEISAGRGDAVVEGWRSKIERSEVRSCEQLMAAIGVDLSTIQ